MTLPASPFKGLAYFSDSEHDRLFFFGRERESELVAANLMASRLTVLYGPSGVGKSSLLRAGVVQRLRAVVPAAGAAEERDEVVIVDTWRDDPVAAIAAAARARDDIPLVDALAERAVASGGTLYLLLDQMEEYVLYHGRDGGPLAAELEEILTRGDTPVHILLGVRDDALADLDAFKRRVPALFGNVLRLDHLTRAAARSAIEGPLSAYAELGGAEVTAEDELVEAVLDEVAAGRIERQLSGRGLVEEGRRERRVEAPYLQLVLERLWDVERERGSDVLRAATLAELGGAQRIVEEHLERALADLDDGDRDLVARLFNHLVTPSGTKIAHAVDDLARYSGTAQGRLEPVLGALEAARILRRVAARSGGPPRYEIFHDVLAPAVLAWRDRHESERTLAKERADARRRHRRLGLIAAGALLALVGTLALAGWALAQRQEAREFARSAEARELSADALSVLGVDPQQALRLAVRAAETEPSTRAESVLRRALRESRVRLTVSVDPPVEALAVGPDGEIFAASPRLLRVFDGGLDEVRRHELPGKVLELRSDAVVAVSGRTVSIVDPATGRVKRRVTIPLGRLPVRDLETGDIVASVRAPKSIRLAALGPKQTLLALSDGSRRTVIVNALTGEGRYPLEQPTSVTSLSVGPAARILAAGGTDGSVRLWALGSGKKRGTLRFGHVGHVDDIAFSPRATLVATASSDGTARVWRVHKAQPVSVLAGHTSFVNDVAFSADGFFLATAGRDGVARTWKVENGAARATFLGHRDSVSAAAFLPGTRAVTSGAEGTIRIWDTLWEPWLPVVKDFGRPVVRVRFTARGLEAVTADRRLHVIDADGKELSQRAAPSIPVERSADGATATIDGSTVVVRRPNARTLVLRGHRDDVTSVAFSPSGRRLVTSSRDHDAIVWDARSGDELQKLVIHSAIVSDAQFSPDGRWIVTAGPQKAGLWDASTGERQYLLQGNQGLILSAAFDPTSRLIVTGGEDGTVRRWRCTICGHADELLRVAHMRLAAARTR